MAKMTMNVDNGLEEIELVKNEELDKKKTKKEKKEKKEKTKKTEKKEKKNSKEKKLLYMETKYGHSYMSAIHR